MGAFSVGGVIQAAGSIYSGIQESKALKSSAKAKDIEAEQTRARGIWQQIRGNEETRRMLSTQRAILGQTGMSLEGAPTELMSRTKQESVMDRTMFATNTAQDVAALHADAKALRSAARAAKTGGIIGAFGSFF